MAEEFESGSVFDSLGQAPEPEAPNAEPSVEAEASVFDSIQTAPSGQIRMAVEASESLQTPQAQRIMNLSSDLGVSPYIVRDAPDQSEKISRLSQYDFDEFQMEAPKLTEWLQNDPIKLKALWEDLSVYKAAETDVKHYGFFEAFTRALEYSFAQAGESLAQLPLAMSSTGGPASHSTAMVGYSQEQVEEFLGPDGAPPEKEVIAQAMRENPMAIPFRKWKELNQNLADFEQPWDKFENSIANGDLVQAGRLMAINTAAQAPNIALNLAALFVTRGRSAILGVMGAQKFAGKFQEGIEAEDVSPRDSFGNALFSAGVEAGTEKMNLGVLDYVGKRIANRFGKETLRRVMFNLMGDIAIGVGGEIAEEEIANTSDYITDKIVGIDKTPFSVAQYLKGAKETAYATIGSAGLTTTAASVGFRAKTYMAAKRDSAFYEGLLKRIEQAKTKDTVPGSTEQVTEAVTKGSPVEHVWVDAVAFKTLFQKGDSKTPEQEMSEMGIPVKDFEQAVDAGGNVKVPLAKWAGKYAGTPVALGMKADISFDPARGTYNQELKLQDAMTALVKSAPGIVDDPRLQEEGALGDPKKLTEIIQTKRRADELVKFYEELRQADPTQTQAATQAIDQILAVKEQLPDPEGEHKILREGISNLISKEATGLGQSSREGNIDIWEEWILRRAVTMGKKPLDILKNLNVSIQQARSQADLDPVTGQSVLYQKGLPAVQLTVSPLGLYSKVEEEALKMDFKSMPAKDLKNRIANIQGIKKEEIEWMGLNEWLDARAAEPEGTVWEVSTKAGTKRFVSKEIAEAYAKEHYPELDYPKGYVTFTEAPANKVTKDQLIEFIRKNGVQLEQVVLSEGFVSEKYKDAQRAASASDAEWGEPEWATINEVDPGGYYIYEELRYFWKEEAPNKNHVLEDLAAWHEELKEAEDPDKPLIKSVKALLMAYRKRPHADWNKVSELWPLIRDRFGETPHGESAKEKIQEGIIERVESGEDDFYSQQKVGISVGTQYYQIIGNHERGWYFDRRYNVDGWNSNEGVSLEEAKVQFIQHLIEQGVLEEPQVEEATEEEKESETFDPNRPVGRTKFASYKVPGGENYREFLLTVPNVSPSFRGGHWSQENVLAHVRTTDRTDAQGKKVLFIEELQSDWMQKGREQGYQGEEENKLPDGFSVREHKKNNKYKFEVVDLEGKTAGLGETEEAAIADYFRVNKPNLIPNAPFKQTDAWAALAMKRMLRLAVDQGYDSIAWAPAAVHTYRWGTDIVSWKKVDGFVVVDPKTREVGEKEFGRVIGFFPTENTAQNYIQEHHPDYPNKFRVEPFAGWVVSSNEQLGGNADGMNIEETARSRGELLEGARPVKTIEELREQIGDILRRERSDRSLESLTQQVWKLMQEKDSGVKKPRAEGFEFFYDNLLPKKVLPQILKKLDKDAKVERNEQIPETGYRNPIFQQWKVDLTPTLKASVKKGMTLFQKPGDGGPLGQTAFANDQVIVTLFAGKNPSTLPHESMHYFVSEMAKDIAELQLKSPDELTPDQVRYMQDAAAMLEFAGAESFETLTEEGQEKIAKAFEAYLMRGKAPSKKLRRAFKRFAVWLTSLYMRAKNELNVELTPEMIRVFDNMLSVESAAQAARGPHDTLFDDPKLYGFNNQEATRYRKAIDDSVLAQEENVRQILLKEQERELKRERRAIRDRVAKEVEQRREYQLIGRLKEAGVKIDANLIIDIIGEEAYKKLPKGVAAKTSDGQLITPEAAAEAMDYVNVLEMFEELQKTPPIEEAIEAETERQFNEIFGDMIQQGRIEQEAIDAYNNRSMADKIRLELEMLMSENFRAFAGMAKKINKRLPSQEEITASAKAVVSRLNVSELKEAQYKRAMDHARAEAMSLFLEGKYEEAWEAKRRELLNHEIVREVTRAKKEVESSLKRFRVLRRTDEQLSKTRDIDLVNAARMVLYNFGLYSQEGRHGKDPVKYLSALKADDPELYEALTKIIDNAVEGVREPIDYSGISFAQFQRVRDAALALWSVAKSHNEIEIEGKKMQRKQAVAELNQDIAKFEGKKSAVMAKVYDKYGPELETFILGGIAWLTKVEHWADAMGPNFKRYITRPVFHAIDNYRDGKTLYFQRFRDMISPLKGSMHRKVIAAPELGGTKKEFRGRNELLGMLRHIGNSSNKMKLVVGYGWGSINEDTGEVDTSRLDAFIARMIKEGQITKADMDIIQAEWDLYEELKPALQRSHKDQFGYYFDEITANPVTLPFGTYRGGYVPAMRDPILAVEVERKRNTENLLTEQSINTFPTTGRGATISRVGGAEPLLLSMNAGLAHLDWAMRFIHINPAVNQVGRLINDRDFKAAMDGFDKRVINDLLLPWAKRAANQKKALSSSSPFLKGLNQFARFIRKFAGLQTLGFNVTNSLQNASGEALAATKVNPVYLAKAHATFLRNPFKSSEEVARRSKFMRNRVHTQLYDIMRDIEESTLDPSRYERVSDWIQNNAYVLSKFSQNILDHVTWIGAYQEAIAKELGETEAVALADEAVRLTQGSFEAESQSRIEHLHPMSQLFLMFFSYFNNVGNLNYYQAQKNFRENVPLKKKFAKQAYLYMAGFMLPAVMTGAIAKIMSGDDWDDDDDGEIWDDVLFMFFNEQASQFMAMIPGGSLLRSIRNLTDDKIFNNKISISPAIELVYSAAKGAIDSPETARKIWEGEILNKQEIRDVLTLLGLMSRGLPILPLAKPIIYQQDIESGKAEPTGPVDYIRGMVTGRPGGK